MTYAQDESSRESGSPIELYDFVGQGATASIHWRYTSASEDYTLGADVYAAIPMQRSSIEIGADGVSPELSVTLPIDLDLVSRYVFSVAPQGLDLTVQRVHKTTGSAAIYWRGPVTSWTVKENLVHVRCPTPLAQLMSREIPRIRYQRHCNNRLFDSVCTLAVVDYSVTGVISTVSADGKILTIASSGLASKANYWAAGGEIINSANNESRMVLSQLGTTVSLIWPFSVNTGVGAAVSVLTGCDHTIDTCVMKFANEDNFNGMPNITTQDIMNRRTGRG